MRQFLFYRNKCKWELENVIMLPLQKCTLNNSWDIHFLIMMRLINLKEMYEYMYIEYEVKICITVTLISVSLTIFFQNVNY